MSHHKPVRLRWLIIFCHPLKKFVQLKKISTFAFLKSKMMQTNNIFKNSPVEVFWSFYFYFYFSLKVFRD